MFRVKQMTIKEQLEHNKQKEEELTLYLENVKPKYVNIFVEKVSKFLNEIEVEYSYPKPSKLSDSYSTKSNELTPKHNDTLSGLHSMKIYRVIETQSIAYQINDEPYLKMVWIEAEEIDDPDAYDLIMRMYLKREND